MPLERLCCIRIGNKREIRKNLKNFILQQLVSLYINWAVIATISKGEVQVTEYSKNVATIILNNHSENVATLLGISQLFSDNSFIESFYLECREFQALQQRFRTFADCCGKYGGINENKFFSKLVMSFSPCSRWIKRKLKEDDEKSISALYFIFFIVFKLCEYDIQTNIGFICQFLKIILPLLTRIGDSGTVFTIPILYSLSFGTYQIVRDFQNGQELRSYVLLAIYLGTSLALSCIIMKKET